MELSCTATPECLAGIRTEVRRLLADRLDERTVGEVSLAVSEACANVVAHAYRDLPPGPLQVRLELLPGELRVTLRDRGHPVDPAKCRARDLGDVRPGGLGTHFMKCAFDPIEYHRDPDGWNRLVLIRKLTLPGGDG